MKKYFLLAISILTITLTAENVGAQCNITLSVDSGNCYLPSTLRLNADFGFYQIEWYLAGNLIQSYTSTWDTSGVGITVAGGNGSGSQLTQFRPYDIEVDDTSNVYIADGLAANKRVLKWAPGATTGTMAADGINSPQPSNFAPNGLAFDKNNDFYIGDDANNRILTWIPGASSGTTYVGTGNGNGPTEFNNLNGICFDTADNLYVADAFNFRIQKWPRGAAGATTLADNLTGNIQFVSADLDGNLYVSDFNNNRILRFAPGSSQEVTVAGDPDGVGGATDSFLSHPEGVYVDGLKNLYIADYSNHRVQMWPDGAKVGINIGAGNGQGPASNQLNLPSGIRQDKWGNVYVADLLNYRIQKYEPHITDTFEAVHPGVYTVVVKAFNGCIFTDSIGVYPTVEPAVITVNQFTLGTTADYSHYQWIFENDPIAGATGSTYVVTKNGDYRVAIEDENGCRDTSDVYKVTNVDETSISGPSDLAARVSIYPNPARETINIEAPVRVSVIIIDMYGKVIREVENARNFSVSDLSAGIYLLRIFDGNKNLVKVQEFTKIR